MKPGLFSCFRADLYFGGGMARSNSELENKLLRSFRVRADFTSRRRIRPFAERQGPGPVQALRRLRSCSAAASTSSVQIWNVFNM